jgi:arsenate reductase-like glutaredoxin family protein
LVLDAYKKQQKWNNLQRKQDNLYLKQLIAAILEQPEILQRLSLSIIEDHEFDNYLMENHAKKKSSNRM